MDGEPRRKVTITVPEITGEAAADAMDVVEGLVARYRLKPKDADALFDAVVAIYIRGRMVQGDRRSAPCPLSRLDDSSDEPD